MALQVLVPDVGDAAEVEVIEILVSVGDVIAKDDSLVVLESDKASMEIPSPEGGKVLSISVKEGDTVNEGDQIVELEVESEEVDTEKDSVESDSEPETGSESEPEPEAETETESEPESESESESPTEQTINVPDVGDAEEVLVTEILVKPGDKLEAEDSLVVLESDKASMEIPTPVAGEVVEILVTEGASVKEGDPLVKLLAVNTAKSAKSAKRSEWDEWDD